MSLLTRSSNIGLDLSNAQFMPQIPGLVAGEDIDPASPCRIDATDGKVYMSNGTAADANAKCNGFSPPYTVKSGQAITLFGPGVRFKYGSGLTPGARYYIGATKGRLDTAATTGDAAGVAFAIDDQDIYFFSLRP